MNHYERKFREDGKTSVASQTEFAAAMYNAGFRAGEVMLAIESAHKGNVTVVGDFEYVKLDKPRRYGNDEYFMKARDEHRCFDFGCPNGNVYSGVRIVREPNKKTVREVWTILPDSTFMYTLQDTRRGAWKTLWRELRDFFGCK